MLTLNNNKMITVGQKIGAYVILKPSGYGFWEISNGRQVLRIAEEDILKEDFNKGSLMYNIFIEEIKKKSAAKKTIKKKKK